MDNPPTRDKSLYEEALAQDYSMQEPERTRGQKAKLFAANTLAVAATLLIVGIPWWPSPGPSVSSDFPSAE